MNTAQERLRKWEREHAIREALGFIAALALVSAMMFAFLDVTGLWDAIINY